ncbi:SgcJ/EcaC family oxidoreductase [Azospirillum sp. TSO22-1]|uniref:YybH family protein n=1 Tax=Azospirillum sp. TSO22-1 TaxID=716789 RepID=UPI000D652669|nr:SgcJ/EcaC family oxidoreductase [Azospirillum sp. TSO22-1]
MTATEAERAIRAVIEDWLAKVRAKDAAGIAALYTTDATFMLPNAEALGGREAIGTAWTQLFSLPELALNFGPTRIDVAEAADMAVEIGTYLMQFDRDGHGVSDRGKYLVVWKRTAEGWRAAADILNSDLPVGTPGQASAAILDTAE